MMNVPALKASGVCVVAALVLQLVAAQESAPLKWPNKFVMYQRSYFPTVNNAQQEGFMYYNFDDLLQRVDHTLTSGSIPGVSHNMSEFWIRDNFYIVDWVNSSCVPIPIGFGMPRPDWFLTNVTSQGSLYLMHEQESALTNCTWLRHDAPISPFNYFYNARTGKPYRLQAPAGGPLQGEEVINNWYEQTEVASFSDDRFKLPNFCPPLKESSVTASSIRDKERLIWNPLVHVVKNL